VFPVNPLQASRYREWHGVSGAKSDGGDARMLADMVRTDLVVRPLVPGLRAPGDLLLCPRVCLYRRYAGFAAAEKPHLM
jgi:hypothetical protein